jgi:hypothetical protein
MAGLRKISGGLSITQYVAESGPWTRPSSTDFGIGTFNAKSSELSVSLRKS